MTPLAAHLVRRITATGPITIAEYMADCLLHPTHGYYTTRDPFGQAGDFITAPEISQMFGELLGLCLAQTWMDQGAPGRIQLVDLGAGRGTLMADMLRATRAVPGFHEAAKVVLVEASPAMQAVQRDTLSDHAPTFHASLADLPEAPLFLVANEFFDALPIRQYQRTGSGWRERIVGVEDGALTIGLAPEGPVPPLDHRLAGTEPGQIVELGAPAQAMTTDIARRIAGHGGGALIFDYGDGPSIGDTLQAVRNHEPVDVLALPGQSDLTAHVDFQALARAAAPARASALVPQGEILHHLGIAERAQALAERLDGPARAAHLAAYHRLTDPSEMGTLFKALALSPPDTLPPPGFDP